MVEALKVFDKDGSGFISTDEVKRILLTLGEKLSAKEARPPPARSPPRALPRTHAGCRSEPAGLC